MTDQFVAEIRVFPFNFPPTGWAFCDGALLPISQNTALFSLLGTVYGGDGRATFGLPDLRDQALIGPGQGPGLDDYEIGARVGDAFVTLLESEIPHHVHGLRATTSGAELSAPGPDRALARSMPGEIYRSDPSAPHMALAPQALSIAGGSMSHDNRQPLLALNFCIALQGNFPPRG